MIITFDLSCTPNPNYNSSTMKSILIETASDEQLKMIEAFIKEHQLKGFIVEGSKASSSDFLNDVIRVLIPIA